MPDGKPIRHDMAGWFCFRFFDDRGKTWSKHMEKQQWSVLTRVSQQRHAQLQHWRQHQPVDAQSDEQGRLPTEREGRESNNEKASGFSFFTTSGCDR